GPECPSPGIFIFQRIFWDCPMSHLTGVLKPSTIPEADGPLKEGQFWLAYDSGNNKQIVTSKLSTD
ncbi:MAG: hypothetical protein V3R92_01485, partial [Dehalococcoidales bacterium]